MAAIAAQHGAKMYKTDTTQAFLYGDVEEDLFVRAPDWWPELVPEGHCLQLKKNIYGTRQAARAGHLRISGWMESHGYPAINSEKTMFMKWDGDDFILHGLLWMICLLSPPQITSCRSSWLYTRRTSTSLGET